MSYTQSKDQKCPFCKQLGKNHKSNCPYYKEPNYSNYEDTFGSTFSDIFGSTFNQSKGEK